MPRRLTPWLLASLVLAGASALGCGDDQASTETPAEGDSQGERVHGLTEAQRREPLAVIGERTITVGEFADELASKGSFIRARYASPERRREFLDQMIRFELLAQEARRRGYHALPEVERTRKQMMIRRFLEERFDRGGPESIPEEEVRAYYEQHRSEFHTPEQVRASHIQVRDRATAQRILQQLLASPNDLRLYRQLADQHNTDQETRDRFGDLRFFSRPSERAEGEPDVPPEVAEAAFRIERIGGIYPEVVRSQRGYHVVKLTGRRAPMHRSFEEAERPIRDRLYRQRREEAIQRLVDELRAEADVEENLDLLGEVRLDLPEGDSPTIRHPQLEPATRPSQQPPGGATTGGNGAAR
ncbi:MAG TPA: peptidylprolyl isomerase [Sandaracinaceae bacterium]